MTQAWEGKAGGVLVFKGGPHFILINLKGGPLKLCLSKFDFSGPPPPVLYDQSLRGFKQQTDFITCNSNNKVENQKEREIFAEINLSRVSYVTPTKTVAVTNQRQQICKGASTFMLSLSSSLFRD